MIQYLGLIQQGLFFGFFLTLLLVIVSYYLNPFLHSKVESMNPAQQSNIFFFWSILPVLGPVFILLIALLPSLLEILGISSDHCLGHPEGHLHFCLIHLQAPVNSLFIWGPGIIYLATLLIMLSHLCVDFCEILRFKRKINNFHPKRIDTDLFLLNTTTPLALCCGIRKQQIFLSTGLTDKLNKDEYKIVIKHERAHIKRKDALKKLLARSFSLTHLPSIRRKLLSSLILANEQACDNASILQHQDKTKAAELLVKIEKLYQGHFFSQSALSSGVMSKESSFLAERVHNLLDEKNSPVQVLPLILCVMTVISLPLGHDLIHDSLEHVMSIVSIFIS
tara:strand:+ start:238300 stop:239307 length:1008 start_codon:yes stop_codon:yes gene_type:complete